MSPSFTQPSASLPRGLLSALTTTAVPSQKYPVSLSSKLSYQLAISISIALIITPITYRVCRTMINAALYMLQDREYITEEGSSYSPVTYFTRLSEQANPEIIYINNKDTVRNIPDIIGAINTLKQLYVYHSPIRKLPDNVGNLSSLQYVTIQNTLLDSLPITMANNQNLIDLSLQGNKITKLPDIFGSLQKLEVLNLAHNNLTSLPPSISDMSHLMLLDLTGNKLTSVPRNLPPNLEILFLGGNPIPIRKLEEAQLRYAPTDLIIFY